LTIVQGLEGSVSVVPQELSVASGETETVMAVLSVGQQADDTALCTLTAYYPNATIWFDAVNMTSIGSDGIYSRDVVFDGPIGNYQAISSCSGGLLASPVRGAATWYVFDNVVMQMVS
jgi:hypothetical protein